MIVNKYVKRVDDAKQFYFCKHTHLCESQRKIK